MIKRILFLSALCLLIQLSLFSSILFAREKTAPSTPPQAAFDKLVDEYFDFHFQFHPTEGTQAGLHQYDGKLEDFSRASVDAEIAGLQKFQENLSSIQSNQLSEESAGDLEVLTSAIQARLLELQNPSRCGEKIPMSIFRI